MPIGLALAASSVKSLAGLLDCLGRGEPLVRQPGDDQVLVAERLVELDGALQGVARERVQPGVGAAALQAVVVEQLAQVLGLAAVVAGELDALVAHLGHRFEHARQVLAALVRGPSRAAGRWGSSSVPAVHSVSACASLVRKSATVAGNGFSVSSLNSGRGARSKISSVIPGGISSVAACRRAVLYEALRRLPEMPKT